MNLSESIVILLFKCIQNFLPTPHRAGVWLTTMHATFHLVRSSCSTLHLTLSLNYPILSYPLHHFAPALSKVRHVYLRHLCCQLFLIEGRFASCLGSREWHFGLCCTQKCLQKALSLEPLLWPVVTQIMNNKIYPFIFWEWESEQKWLNFLLWSHDQVCPT